MDLGLPGGSAVKNLPVYAGDMDSILGSRSLLGGGNGNPLQYSYQRKRALVAYSPWSRKDLDTTEQLSVLLLVRITGSKEHRAQ